MKELKETLKGVYDLKEFLPESQVKIAHQRFITTPKIFKQITYYY